MADDIKDNTEVEPDEQELEKTDEVGKIKLGEEEYTQEDLNSLVGLGKIAKEAEEKYNVKIEGIWPKFQQTINENVDFRKQREQEEKAKEEDTLTQKASTDQDLTEEEQLKLASLKLKELGFVSREDVMGEVNNIIAGKQLLSEVDNLVKTQAEAGNPKTSSEELLSYMEANGIKNPVAAYKLKFEDELDQIKEKKIGGIKKDNFVTEEAGSGNKIPQQKPITRNNLTEALSEVLNQNS